MRCTYFLCLRYNITYIYTKIISRRNSCICASTWNGKRILHGIALITATFCSRRFVNAHLVPRVHLCLLQNFLQPHFVVIQAIAIIDYGWADGNNNRPVEHAEASKATNETKSTTSNLILINRNNFSLFCRLSGLLWFRYHVFSSMCHWQWSCCCRCRHWLMLTSCFSFIISVYKHSIATFCSSATEGILRCSMNRNIRWNV